MSHPSVFPTMRYADPVAAIEFLVAAFGAERHVVYEDGGVIRHAELRFGNGIVMLGGVAPGEEPYGGAIYIVVDDVDTHAERARAAGAEIVREPADTDYGSRECAAKDLEQRTWYFGTYQPFDAV